MVDGVECGCLTIQLVHALVKDRAGSSWDAICLSHQGGEGVVLTLAEKPPPMVEKGQSNACDSHIYLFNPL